VQALCSDPLPRAVYVRARLPEKGRKSLSPLCRERFIPFPASPVATLEAR